MNQKLLWTDFRYFLFHLWKFLGLPEPTPVQYEVAEWFQWCTIGGGPKRSITIAFRGIGKSWIRTGGTLFLAGNNPDWKFFLPSATREKSNQFTQFTRMIMDTWEVVSFLRPTSRQRDTSLGFDFGPAAPAQAPSVTSCGIGGQMTGSRADFIFPDDVEIPNNSFSEIKREQLLTAWSEFDSILSPGGVIHGQGTPQTEESIYLKLIRDRGYHARFWPAEIPKDSELGPYLGFLAPSLYNRVLEGHSGQPADPTRFDTDELLQKKSGSGLSHYRLHFMLDTSLSDQERYPLKTKDLIVVPLMKTGGPTQVVWGCGPEYRLKEFPNVGFSGDHFSKPSMVSQQWENLQGSHMFIDPAGTGGDELAWCIMGHLMGNLYVPSFGGMPGGYCRENLEKLADIARDHKVNCVYVEDNMGDGMFRALLQPVLHRKHQCGLEGFKVTGQKELRIIAALEPLLNSHRLILDYTAVKADLDSTKEEIRHSLFYQMTHITKQRKALQWDDRLDCLASAARHWANVMEIDNSAAIERHKKELEDRALEEWLDGATPLVPGESHRGRLQGANRVAPMGVTNWSDPLRPERRQ
jgi:hypothetical protein